MLRCLIRVDLLVEHIFDVYVLLIFVQVDFCQLQVNTLRRYKRHYKLQTRPGLNKSQLVEVTIVEMYDL